MSRRLSQALAVATFAGVPCLAQAVLGSVPLPNQPAGQIAYDRFTDRVFVAGGMAQLSTHVVDVSDPSAPFVVGTLPLAGCAIQDLTHSAVFFGSTGFGGQVVRGDTATLLIGASTTIGYCGGQFAIAGGYVFATSQCGGGNDPLHVMNGAMNVLAGPLGTGGIAGAVYAKAAPLRIYCNRSGGTAVFTGTGCCPSFGQLAPIADSVSGIDDLNDRVYAATSGGGLQVLDGTTHALIANLPGLAGQVAVDGAAGRAYVASYAGGLEVLDASSWAPLGSVPAPSGQMSALVSFDPNSRRVFYVTTGPGGSTLHVIDAMDANVAAFGSSCLSGFSLTGPVPVIGTTFQSTCTGFTASSLAVAVVGLSQLSLPLSSVHPAGIAGCNLLANPDAVVITAVANGASSYQLPIPGSSAFISLQLFHQFLQVNSSLGLSSSNGLHLSLGL